MEKEKKGNGKKIAWTIVCVVLVIVAVLLIIFGARANKKHREDYFCQYAKQFSSSEVAGGDKMIVVGHRGLPSQAPENTLPSYVEAAKHGIKFVENDIMPTKDGVWVVSHDDNLVRMTGYDGEIEDMTLKEVQSHPLTEGANIKQYPNLVTPTYEDWLKALKKYNLYPVIEIKTDSEDANYREVIDLLKKYDLYDQATIISFEEEPMEIIRSFDKTVKMQWLSDYMDQDAIDFAKKLGNCGLDIDYNDIMKHPDMAKKAVAEGLVLNTWTVDDKDIASQAVKLGCTFVTSNCILPDAANKKYTAKFAADYIK